MITLTKLSIGGVMDKAPEQKVCKKCKQEKPLKEFIKNSKMNDGHLNTCKSCTSKLKAERKKEKRKYREYFFDPKTPAF